MFQDRLEVWLILWRLVLFIGIYVVVEVFRDFWLFQYFFFRVRLYSQFLIVEEDIEGWFEGKGQVRCGVGVWGRRQSQVLSRGFVVVEVFFVCVLYLEDVFGQCGFLERGVYFEYVWARVGVGGFQISCCFFGGKVGFFYLFCKYSLSIVQCWTVVNVMGAEWWERKVSRLGVVVLVQGDSGLA